MAAILLLHSALGLRPAVVDFAERLRELGHVVEAPDYYEGRVFDDEGSGIAHRDAHPEYFERVRALASRLPADTALAGFSLGAWFAQRLAAGRPHAAAAILMHSAAPARGAWPGVPVQVHRRAVDPWIDPSDVASLGAAVRASGAAFEDHVSPGRGHLFTDLGGPDADSLTTASTLTRIDAFLR
ncbi:dienelactone hydrolase family protein [Knoellia sp. Soil729]|uniref:dienelactone hydrolase family protein n=1 Tax=Knoellia sp. Soil729 TaxID=1736394 RepID=UPI0006F6CDA7|nr:dienelactone hydrolase family protein [Knoellia sp. Soil729]KRE42973.1 carboxymethylenebutenolidase [Knoellia sp. Soil729]